MRLLQQPADLMFLTSTLLMGASATAITLTVSASFWVGLLFAWQRLCQGQEACMQSETIVNINLPTMTKVVSSNSNNNGSKGIGR